MEREGIALTLTSAEALVLFEWLSCANEQPTLSFADPAEQQVLWGIEAQLEKTLVEPFKPNYCDLVEAARREVRGDISG